MEFNVDKSHVMKLRSGRRLERIYKMGDSVKMKKVDKERDLGVIVQENSQQCSHVGKIFDKTCNLVKNIRLAFHYMDKYMMKKLISTLIRHRLEYAVVV